MTADPNALAMAKLLAGLVAGFLAAVGALVAVDRWRGNPPLFAESKRRTVPWGPVEAVGALLLQVGLVEVLTVALVPGRRSAAPIRGLLLAHAVASLAAVGLIVALLRLLARARAADFGLARRGLGRNVLRGAAACALALPVVYAVQFVAIQAWPPRSHPVERAIAADPSALTALVSVLGAVVVAPLAEEFVFRGVLLGWLWKASPPGSRSSDFLANVIVSTLFAAMHSAQWPAPIPLFVLSLILGEVYRRSGSLVAPVALHACFNGLSTAALWIGVAYGAVPKAG